MQISPITKYKFSFKSSHDEHIKDNSDVKARQYIREHLEKNLGITYTQHIPINSCSSEEFKAQFLHNYTNKSSQTQKKNSSYVNENKLEEISHSYIKKIRDNELYSGPRLIDTPKGIKLAKEAGINSILSLECRNDSQYGEMTREAGLKFIGLSDIGNNNLSVFGIIQTGAEEPKLIKELINKPQKWATLNQDKTKKSTDDEIIKDIQNFIDILNGEDENYPPPVYYGCELGTNRTWFWTKFYNILKNEDRTKELNNNTIQKLIELEKETEEIYRY